MAPIFGTILGGIISGAGQAYAARQNKRAQQAAADLAYKRSLPFDVHSGLGSATFDSEGRRVDLELSPELEAQRQEELASLDRQRGFLSGIEADPEEAAQRQYERELALFAPEQRRELLELEERQKAQGIGLSTLGGFQRQGVSQAQGNVRLQARLGASDRVQNLIDRYRGRISGNLGTAVDLAGAPLALGQFGASVGQGLSPAAIRGGDYLSGAGTTTASATSGLFKGIGSSVADIYNKPSIAPINTPTYNTNISGTPLTRSLF